MSFSPVCIVYWIQQTLNVCLIVPTLKSHYFQQIADNIQELSDIVKKNQRISSLKCCDKWNQDDGIKLSDFIIQINVFSVKLVLTNQC